MLDPDEFYILVSQEAVHVPPLYAAEMTPFDPLVGEFRVHYAGFFDPGFGHSAAGGTGSRAVLEVRSHEVPFILEHGQIVGRLVYEHMLTRPKALYGTDLGSNYQAQGLKLSKHFKRRVSGRLRSGRFSISSLIWLPPITLAMSSGESPAAISASVIWTMPVASNGVSTEPSKSEPSPTWSMPMMPAA